MSLDRARAHATSPRRPGPNPSLIYNIFAGIYHRAAVSSVRTSVTPASRAVLAWELSNTLDAGFCVRAVQRAIRGHGVPKIFNADQGCQFTSAKCTQPLLAPGVKLPTDGKSPCLDSVFVERLWRTVKHDEIHLKSYTSQIEAHTNLEKFLRFYNEQRPHSAFGNADPMTPMQVYRRDRRHALSA